MLVKTLKRLLGNQYEASLSTLKLCADRCPDSFWDARVANYPFCQVLFHTLFFTDFYLGRNAESLMHQTFHAENRDLFADYEQLQDREPTSVYSREQINRYAEFCRNKASVTIADETEETLGADADFARRKFSRAELHIYSIRHIQHHSAQLTLRLRTAMNVDIPWVSSGWIAPSA